MRVYARIVFGAALLLLPATAMAQAAIAGSVRDTTGAVLPGVTVEASSPALIEKVRTVVTDDEGRYLIVDLRPGTYVATFTLPGFSTVRREGLELAGTFTATVNAEMRVGGLEETITVTGASPLVDTQNVVQQRVISTEAVAEIPTSRIFQTLAAVMAPGLQVTSGVGVANADVGGSTGDQSQGTFIHGGRSGDRQQMIDGLYINGVLAPGQQAIYMDIGSAQETVLDLANQGVEILTGGVHVNLIPKDGGNRYSGSVFGTYANSKFQADNVTDELIARGTGEATSKLDEVWDFNPGFGGPIMQNKLWFYASSRFWGVNNKVASIWYDTDPFDNVYTPDLSRQGIEDTHIYSGSVRLTWQVNEKNKLALYHLNQQGRCLCHRDISATQAPEAARKARSPVMYIGSIKWTAPITSRLLFEAGTGFYQQTYSVEPQPEVWKPGVLALTELSTGMNYRITSIGHDGFQMTKLNGPKVSLSYVTGSHAMKFGMDLQTGTARNWLNINDNLSLNLRNGVPDSFIMYATPYDDYSDLNAALGIWASDQWKMDRFTINAGLRWDYHESSIPEVTLPPVQFVPFERHFNEIPNVPRWTDLNPRLGFTWDVRGDGKTAFKSALSRYVNGEGTGFARQLSPVRATASSTTRSWTDLNGDFQPQCNFLDPVGNLECGPWQSLAFGSVRPTARYDDALQEGFGVREHNWEASVGIQHEVISGVSAEVSYFRRWYDNFIVTDNLAVTSADYDPFCITVPVDSRLSGGGGNQLCGLYDIRPSKLGQTDQFITHAENFGEPTEVYDGLDVIVNARVAGGSRFGGGFNVGRSATNSCFAVDSPQALLNCDVQPPFHLNLRAHWVQALPWDLQASATFQAIPGPEVTASYRVPNSAIAPSLGRNLAAGANASVAVPLIAPGTVYGERMNQVDFRLSRIVRIAGARLRVNLDVFNLLNAAPVILQNNTFGPAWQRPIATLPGRLFKFGGQLDF